MLLGGITLISALVAAAFCFGFDAFAGLAWLWLLPVTFVGTFLVGLAAVFLFVYFACELVDQDVPQEHDSKFYRKMTYLIIDLLIPLVRAKIHTKGLENTPKDGRFVLVCNHLHLADPVLLMGYFRQSQLAFISKQENRDMFIIGKLMHRLMCQTLDRDNDRQALKVILKCIQLIKEDEVSIGVFPEGYTSKDGKLHHFRNGVFKIAQKANVPIVVCTIQGTRDLFHNLKRLKPTDIELHLVGVVPAEELKGKTTIEIGERVHAMMAEDLGPEKVAEE